jgi:MYXO-CTERM domain-containing protein
MHGAAPGIGISTLIYALVGLAVLGAHAFRRRR